MPDIFSGAPFRSLSRFCFLCALLCLPFSLFAKVVATEYGSFAAVRNNDGVVVIWGESNPATTTDPEVKDFLSKGGVKEVVASYDAFAALNEAGEVKNWGDPAYGGTMDAAAAALLKEKGVVRLFANYFCFSALRKDGSAVAFPDYCSVPTINAQAAHLSYMSKKDDGSVVAFPDYHSIPAIASDLGSKIVNIVPSKTAFAALKEDGSVVVWGLPEGGGDNTQVAHLSHIKRIVASRFSFAALDDKGTVFTWGLANFGGRPEFSFPPTMTQAERDDFLRFLSKDVVQVIPSAYGFAALKADGSLVAWGRRYFHKEMHGIRAVASTKNGYAAIRDDNTLITWGATDVHASQSIQDAIKNAHDILDFRMTEDAFAVLLDNSPYTLLTWGTPTEGGTLPTDPDLKKAVQSLVRRIEHNRKQFIAYLKDGSAVVFGRLSTGGHRFHDAQKVVLSSTAFVAVRNDGYTDFHRGTVTDTSKDHYDEVKPQLHHLAESGLLLKSYTYERPNGAKLVTFEFPHWEDQYRMNAMHYTLKMDFGDGATEEGRLLAKGTFFQHRYQGNIPDRVSMSLFDGAGNPVGKVYLRETVSDTGSGADAGAGAGGSGSSGGGGALPFLALIFLLSRERKHTQKYTQKYTGRKGA